jgi:hypothetical protein
MMMAVMTPPVPAPTMAAMPTIAADGKFKTACGRTSAARDAKAAPSVAPRKSEGEKMPPEAPQPRLIVVANSLRTNSRTRRPVAVMP